MLITSESDWVLSWETVIFTCLGLLWCQPRDGMSTAGSKGEQVSHAADAAFFTAICKLTSSRLIRKNSSLYISFTLSTRCISKCKSSCVLRISGNQGLCVRCWKQPTDVSPLNPHEQTSVWHCYPLCRWGSWRTVRWNNLSMSWLCLFHWDAGGYT